MPKYTKVILFSLILFALMKYTSGNRIVCYYNNWAQYRLGKGYFLPENINASLCTHIIYGFAKPAGLGMQSVEGNDEPSTYNVGMYRRVQMLKEQNPDLLVLLAFGDNTQGSYAYIPIVGTPAARMLFAQNAVTFLRNHGFDGLDMNWNYPGTRGIPVVGRSNYAALLQELMEMFDTDSVMREQPRLILSATLPQIKETIDLRYDVVSITNIVDFVSLMTLDFHGSWESNVGVNSPLYIYPGAKGYQKYLSLDWVAKYYGELELPKDKINIGISLYGRSFTLADPNKHDIGSSAKGAGKAGPYTKTKGLLAYYEVCELLGSGATKIDVTSQHNRYLVLGDQWVGYDDIQSVSEKACYTKVNGFGGVMIRSLDFDDFSGQSCGQGKYPLISAIVAIMDEDGFNTCNSYSFLFASSSGSLQSAEHRLAHVAIIIVWSVVRFINH